MLDTRQSWPSTYSGHLIIANTDLAVFNNVAKVLNATLCKRAFILLCAQLVLAQSLKDCVQVFNVLTCGLTLHQNTIQVYSDILIARLRLAWARGTAHVAHARGQCRHLSAVHTASALVSGLCSTWYWEFS